MGLYANIFSRYNFITQDYLGFESVCSMVPEERRAYCYVCRITSGSRNDVNVGIPRVFEAPEHHIESLGDILVESFMPGPEGETRAMYNMDISTERIVSLATQWIDIK